MFLFVTRVINSNECFKRGCSVAGCSDTAGSLSLEVKKNSVAKYCHAAFQSKDESLFFFS